MIIIFKNILLGLMLFILPFSGFSQFFETRQLITVSAGYSVLNGSENNLFFPSSLKHSGLSFDLSYSHKVKPWLAAGVAVGYNDYASSNNEVGFSLIKNYSCSFYTVGPQIVMHSPFKSNGVFNRFRCGLSIAPQYHYYVGERFLLVNNEIQALDGGEIIQPSIEMNTNSSGFGVKISPEINCRITQRFGLKLAYNFQLLSVYTGYNTENLSSNSMMVGLIFTFGNSKSLF